MRTASFAKNRKIERLEACAVSDNVDLSDFSTGKGEFERPEETSARGDDDADRAIDQGNAGENGASSEGKGLPGPGLGSACSRCQRGQNSKVGFDLEIRVEHGNERLEVAGA
jgi:hypothetical protein